MPKTAESTCGKSLRPASMSTGAPRSGYLTSSARIFSPMASMSPLGTTWENSHDGEVSVTVSKAYHPADSVSGPPSPRTSIETGTSTANGIRMHAWRLPVSSNRSAGNAMWVDRPTLFNADGSAKCRKTWRGEGHRHLTAHLPRWPTTEPPTQRARHDEVDGPAFRLQRIEVHGPQSAEVLGHRRHLKLSQAAMEVTLVDACKRLTELSRRPAVGGEVGLQVGAPRLRIREKGDVRMPRTVSESVERLRH